jgi:hypothetical protein
VEQIAAQKAVAASQRDNEIQTANLPEKQSVGLKKSKRKFWRCIG